MAACKRITWVMVLLALLPATAAAEDRTNWRHSGGSFEENADGTWAEKAKDGTYQFEEKDRTDQYVELYDKSRNITVRLTPAFCLVKVGGKGAFKRTYRGAWMAAAETKPEPKTRTLTPKPPDAKVVTPPDKADGPFAELATFPGHGDINLYNFGIAVSPDGQRIALTLGTSLEPEFGILEVATGKVMKRWRVPTLVQPLVWSDDGSSLAGILLGESKPDGRKSQVVVWDTNTWEQRAVFDQPGFPGQLALSRDGNVVAAASGSVESPGVLNIWNVPTQKLLFTYEIRGGSPHIALTANGKSAAADGLGPNGDQIVLFDLPGGKPRRAVQGIGPFALSPDGNILILWAYGTSGLQIAVSGPARRPAGGPGHQGREVEAGFARPDRRRPLRGGRRRDRPGRGSRLRVAHREARLFVPHHPEAGPGSADADCSAGPRLISPADLRDGWDRPAVVHAVRREARAVRREAGQGSLTEVRPGGNAFEPRLRGGGMARFPGRFQYGVGSTEACAAISVEWVLRTLSDALKKNGRPGRPGDPMKLNSATCYAIHALAVLAGQKGLVTARAIAYGRKIPERFLPKVLHSLVSARVLFSIQGPHGGYHLARPPEEITLLEIVEAVEGPIRGELSFTHGYKPDALDRRLQEICDREAGHVRKQLGKVKLSDLIGNGE